MREGQGQGRSPHSEGGEKRQWGHCKERGFDCESNGNLLERFKKECDEL